MNEFERQAKRPDWLIPQCERRTDKKVVLKLMMRAVIVILFSGTMVTASGQSKTTQNLEDQFEDSRAFFFYNNTLRMINQADDPEFDEIIRDIEKMKLLIIRKNVEGFDFKNIVRDYKSENFEEIMTSRHKGRNFDIFLREEGGKTAAMLVLVNDEENLFVLDILGSIAPNKVAKFFSVMDEESDISNRIKNFVTREREETGDDENGAVPEKDNQD